MIIENILHNRKAKLVIFTVIILLNFSFVYFMNKNQNVAFRNLNINSVKFYMKNVIYP